MIELSFFLAIINAHGLNCDIFVLYVEFSAKNKYGWGAPSSIFTFYNKGVGK